MTTSLPPATNSWCLFVALGTRGDAAPVLNLALGLQRAAGSRCVFLTHATHREWVETSDGLLLGGLAYCNSSPYAREDEADDGAALTGEQRVIISVLQAMFNSGRRPGLLVFNLFALDAYHVAEAFGIRCIAASPYSMPHALPAGFLEWLRGTQPALYAALDAEDAARAGGAASSCAARDARLSLADCRHWAYPLFNADRWRRLRTALGLAPLPGLLLPEETLAKRASAGGAAVGDTAAAAAKTAGSASDGASAATATAVSLPPAVSLLYLFSSRFLTPPASDGDGKPPASAAEGSAAAPGAGLPPTMRAIGFVKPLQLPVTRPVSSACGTDAASALSASTAAGQVGSVSGPATAAGVTALPPGVALAPADSADAIQPVCLCGLCRPLVVSLGSLPHMGIFEVDVDDDDDEDEDAGGNDGSGTDSTAKHCNPPAAAAAVYASAGATALPHAVTASHSAGIDEATVLRFLLLLARAAAAAHVPAILVASGWPGFGVAVAAPDARPVATSTAKTSAAVSSTIGHFHALGCAASRVVDALVPGYDSWCCTRRIVSSGASATVVAGALAAAGSDITRAPPAFDDADLAFIQQHVFIHDGSVQLPALLAHASAAVHHGGSGTTAACLQTGVPQVIVPFMFDQFRWAGQCVGIGVAAAAPPLQELLDGDPDAHTAFISAVLQACTPASAIAEQAARVRASIAAEPDAIALFVEHARPALAAPPPAGMHASPFRIRKCGIDGDIELYEVDIVDGLGCIVTPSLHELAFLHEELWREDCYRLRPLMASWRAADAAAERVIFDVGANVGVFHRMVACMAQEYGIAVRIVCIEPVALTHKLLLRNVQAGRAFDVYAVMPAADAATTSGIVDTVCEQVAVFGRVVAADDADGADASVPDKLTMLTFPHMLGNSTAKPFEKRAALVKSFPDASVRGMLTAGSYAETVPCTTLSLLIDRHAARGCARPSAAATAAAPAIDLLKVDIEGSELEALLGITLDEHWARIQHVVVEVHDVGSRVSDVVRLLRARYASVDVRAASHGDRGTEATGAAGGQALPRGPTHAVMVSACGPVAGRR